MSNPKGTIKVRILVVTGLGKQAVAQAAGAISRTEEEEFCEMEGWFDDLGPYQRSVIEADVPLPDVPVIQAKAKKVKP